MISFHVSSPQAISTLESDNALPSSPVRETSDDKREEREERDHVRTEGESTENIPVNSNQMEESSRYIYIIKSIVILQDLLKNPCLWKQLSFLNVCPSVCPSIHSSICLSCLSVYPFVHLSVLSVCLSLRPSVCLSVCLHFCNIVMTLKLSDD